MTKENPLAQEVANFSVDPLEVAVVHEIDSHETLNCTVDYSLGRYVSEALAYFMASASTLTRAKTLVSFTHGGESFLPLGQSLHLADGLAGPALLLRTSHVFVGRRPDHVVELDEETFQALVTGALASLLYQACARWPVVGKLLVFRPALHGVVGELDPEVLPLLPLLVNPYNPDKMVKAQLPRAWRKLMASRRELLDFFATFGGGEWSTTIDKVMEHIANLAGYPVTALASDHDMATRSLH